MNMFVGAAAMTAAAKTGSVSAQPAVNSDLIALVDECIAADSHAGDLCVQLGRMLDAEETRYPLPPALRIRSTDLELGRKPWQATDTFWHRPCDIGQWRNLGGMK